MHDYPSCHQIYLVIDEIRRFQKDVYNFQEVSPFFFFPLSYGHYFSSIRFFQADSLFFFFFFFHCSLSGTESGMA